MKMGKRLLVVVPMLSRQARARKVTEPDATNPVAAIQFASIEHGIQHGSSAYSFPDEITRKRDSWNWRRFCAP